MNQVQRQKKNQAQWRGALRASELTMQSLPTMDMESEKVLAILAKLYLKGKLKGEALGRAAIRSRGWRLR